MNQGGTAERLYSSLTGLLACQGFFTLLRRGNMYPSFESVKELAETGKYKRIPVCEEMLSDRFTTIEITRTLRAVSSHCYLLESAEAHQQWGRYSFLGYPSVPEPGLWRTACRTKNLRSAAIRQRQWSMRCCRQRRG